MLLQFLLLLLPWLFQSARARVLTLEMHHRFSDPVKHLSNRSGLVLSWPETGSVEYYELLARHDRLLLNALTFSDGNATFRISSLGFLHYTTVTLGTPGTKFLVALDTGSDLFWVPCRCTKCASIDGDSRYTSDFELSIYDPDESPTSRNVTCNNELCTHQNSCSETFSSCPYYVFYISSATSTSGILVEDILHLTSSNGEYRPVKAYVTFGCGQIQTGSFLDFAAPNGLFGLGFEKISVPSVLSKEGYIANSFSMCFGHDGIGRISFGHKGSVDQEETPFNMDPFHPTYNITVTQVRVGTAVLDSEFTALVDSGTSFTYLAEPLFTMLVDSFDAHARDKRHQPDLRIPFEFCYIMSPKMNTNLVPGIGLTMVGGGHLAVNDPIIVISTLHEFVYCLAVVKSPELNIIGQNFLTGYRIVFDREKLVLGWLKFDCYDMAVTDDYEPGPANYASPSPPGVVGILNYTARSEKPNRNEAQSLFPLSLYAFSTILVSLVLAFQCLAPCLVCL